MQEVRRRAAKGPSFFFVVVPNSRPADAPPVLLAQVADDPHATDHHGDLAAHEQLLGALLGRVLRGRRRHLVLVDQVVERLVSPD